MKTTKDIADFLKRNGRAELSYDDKANVFRVVSGGYLRSHKYLDEALELVAEERRRADSGTTLREKEKPQVQYAWFQVPGYAQNITFSVAGTAQSLPQTVTAACGTRTAAGAVCPKCNSLPDKASGQSALIMPPMTFSCMNCKNHWPVTVAAGTVVTLGGRAPGCDRFRFDGTNWYTSP